MQIALNSPKEELLGAEQPLKRSNSQYAVTPYLRNRAQTNDLFLKVLSFLLYSKTGRYGRERGGHAARDHGQLSNPGRCGKDWALIVHTLPGQPPTEQFVCFMDPSPGHLLSIADD